MTEKEDNAALSRSASELVHVLNDLLQLEYDTLGAYEIAIEETSGSAAGQQLTRFRRHHERHVEELNRAVQSVGGIPINEPHATGPLKQALQGLGALAGIRGTLRALRTNEFQVRARYADCVGRAAEWPAAARRVVERHAVEEELHVRWVSAWLEENTEARGRISDGRILDGRSPSSHRAASPVRGLGLGLLAGLGLGSLLRRTPRR